MRDTDRNILQQLLRAHSAVTDIREAQKKNGHYDQLQEQEHNNSGITDSDSKGSIKEDLESSGHSDYYSRDEKTPGSSSHVSLDLPPSSNPTISFTATNTTTQTETFPSLKINGTSPGAKNDDDILAQFFGEESLSKFTCLSKPRSSKSQCSFEENDTGVAHKAMPSLDGMRKQQSLTGLPSDINRSELKVSADEEKRNARSSVAYEMQQLRQKLQEVAKSELEAFDKKFDGPSSVPTFLEVEKKSYRYSILNRMDELLYPAPSSSGNDSNDRRHRSSSHIRQYSEPVVIPPEGVNEEWNSRGHFTTSHSTTFSQLRKSSEPAHSSFRLPTSKTMELSRTGSGYYHDGIGGTAKGSHSRKGSQTHYDTTVIRRRSSNSSHNSSRNNTLERKGKHPLQYSVESLGSGGSNDDVSYNGRAHYQYHQRQASSDYDNPESKSIRYVTRNGSAHSNSDRKTFSPEVYPESMSPSPPLVSPPLSQQGRSYRGPQKPLSAPLKKKHFVRDSPESSWL